MPSTRARQRTGAGAALAQPAAGGPRPDPHWLDAIEHETAELAVAVAAQRAETVHRLQAALASRKDDAFPSAEIALDGWMERLLPEHPAVEIEERYRGILKDNRARDAAAGRTLDGPHLTDLTVIYSPKSIPAADASTGEQKALLIGLVLAHAGLLAEMTGFAPVLLLDEVVAHLDPDRRARALCGARPARRAGFHDRRRPGRLRRSGAAGRRVHREPRAGAAQRLVRAVEFLPAKVPGTSDLSGV